MTAYGDNWIIMNAKNKILHEKYLKENHEQIVNDIATHLGTNHPHITGDREASIKDNIQHLNASAPKGGYTSHKHALNIFRGNIEEIIRPSIESQATRGPSPWTLGVDSNYDDIVDDLIGDIHDAVNPPKQN